MVFRLGSCEGVTASSDQVHTDARTDKGEMSSFFSPSVSSNMKLESVCKLTWGEFSRWESIQTGVDMFDIVLFDCSVEMMNDGDRLFQSISLVLYVTDRRNDRQHSVCSDVLFLM